MAMSQHKNIPLPGPHGLPILTDIFLPEKKQPAPVLIYAHGFNGFKDWGNFDLIATQFAAAGFAFIKFNFSHNGTSPEHPETFVNLSAFEANNYSIELDDLATVIDWATSPQNPYAAHLSCEQLGMIGHSLGGGIVLLQAEADNRVKAVATWAAISKCQTPWSSWSAEKIAAWKNKGVAYITNSRTGQEMPLGYQLKEDFEQHPQRLDIASAVKRLQIPMLICHGTKDPAVPFESALQLISWQPHAAFFSVESDHVFGRKHPWTEDVLPEPTQLVVDRTITFFKVALHV